MPKASEAELRGVFPMAVASLITSSLGLFAVFAFRDKLNGLAVAGAGIVGFNFLYAAMMLAVLKWLSSRVSSRAAWVSFCILLITAIGGLAILVLYLMFALGV